MYSNSYKNAQDAFEDLYHYIMKYGESRSGTLSVYDCMIRLYNPLERDINTPWRKWNKDYADYEWDWYLSGDRSGIEISKRAKIWEQMLDQDGNVNSNYGYQWNRADQLNKVIEMLKKDPTTRRASISLYDGKEIDQYEKDTICTYAINFYISNDALNMQVMMRSNDLVFGFCNDQYCFSKLQELVAQRLSMKLGYYTHYVCNMHIYKRHFNLIAN
jgi:thymidylate synthase